MNMTAIYVMAAVQRAQNEGASSVSLNVKDMIEMCHLIQSGMHKEIVGVPMKHVGWANPFQIQAMRRDRKKDFPLKRRKSAEHCVQVFFSGDIREHMQESIRLVAVREEERRQERERREKANVQSTVP